MSSPSASLMEALVTRRRKKKSLYSSGRVFVFGPHGSGKTTWIKNNFDYVELDYDLTLEEFTSRLDPYTWLLVDNEDFEFPERERTIYVSTRDMVTASDVQRIECRPLERIFHGVQDSFMDTDAYIFQNLHTRRESYIDMIDKCYGEHGNCIGIIHENVTSAEIDMNTMAHVLDEISTATLVDDMMYKGNWDLFKIFNVFGYVIPCKLLNGSVKSRNAASMWTKFLNECMKRKKIREMRIHIDTLWLLKEYATVCQNPENLSSSNLDTLKYVDFLGRLKPKNIQRLKKACVEK